MKNTNLIYKVNCSVCENKYYIGQTGTWLERRLDRHKQNCNSKLRKYNMATGLSSHQTEEKHPFDFQNTVILHKEKNKMKRRILESMFITKNLENTVNNQND